MTLIIYYYKNNKKKNGDGEIEGDELNRLVKDLLELTHREYTYDDWLIFRNGLLGTADLNRDGKINKSEFKIVLMALSSRKNDEN